MDRFDRFTQEAYEMVLSGKVQKAFNVAEESPETRDGYGKESIGQKAILARRLVEAGVTFVLVSGAWGYFDHHGDNVRWGGIEKGLTPMLPRVDRTFYTLVNDLEQRGLLDQTLVMMMGEFGRSPVINKEAGRDHWTNVMSLVMAGGGLSTARSLEPRTAAAGRLPPAPCVPRTSPPPPSGIWASTKTPIGQSPRPAHPDHHRRRPPDSRTVWLRGIAKYGDGCRKARRSGYGTGGLRYS